jgi:penicillin-binding protein 1A
MRQGLGITQVPQVAAAFVAIDADTGAYHALVGGFDYNLQKFNHVTQAWRQPGSGDQALHLFGLARKGLFAGHAHPRRAARHAGRERRRRPGRRRTTTASSTARSPCAARWRNRRTCLGAPAARDRPCPTPMNFLGKFGFDLARQPKNLTLALGTGAVTPLQMAGAYAVFANGGYQVQPYLIAKIEDADGKVIAEVKPPAAQQESSACSTRATPSSPTACCAT